jgi:predicted hotdog family 3-hydroxylacyl-ACP dehydratase
MKNFDSVDVRAIIPQREPFVMIDSLLFAEGNRIETTFNVSPDNIFVEDRYFREFGLIENVAQSFAAGIGIIKGVSQGESAEGFMAALSELTVYGLPEVGKTIYTEVLVTASFEKLYQLYGKCFTDGKLLMECTMKLAGRS